MYSTWKPGNVETRIDADLGSPLGAQSEQSGGACLPQTSPPRLQRARFRGSQAPSMASPHGPHRASHRGAQGTAFVRDVPKTVVCASSFRSSVAVSPMIGPGESTELRFKADNSMFGLKERIYSGAISAVLLGEGPFARTPQTSMT